MRGAAAHELTDYEQDECCPDQARSAVVGPARDARLSRR